MSQPLPHDTIVALATPPGRGGVGIVRISGPLSRYIAEHLLGKLPRPRYAQHGSFLDAAGVTIDTGIVLYFPAPHSFTGEDVLELQAHGSPVVLDLLQKRCIELSARPARPGEFSERAFLNGKLDLAQAEAIADLIDSHTEQAARAAARSLQGEFSAHINSLIEQLIQLRIFVESAIDFPEEDIDFLADRGISNRLEAVLEEVKQVMRSARQGSLLREGLNIVIAGRPNAGKSSLLNCLAGRDSAIVTAIPGTTRDVLREHIHIDGLPLHIIDTAGLRESSDPIEQEGMRRAWAEISRADRVLLIVDAQAGLGKPEQDVIDQLPAKLPLSIVYNKIDLSSREPSLKKEAPVYLLKNRRQESLWSIYLSAKTGAGIDLLQTHLKQAAGCHHISEGTFSARRRHLDALGRAAESLQNGQQQLQQQRAAELLAEDLRQAQLALSEITGAFTTEDLLGRIFSSFCIGK